MFTKTVRKSAPKHDSCGHLVKFSPDSLQ